MVGECFTYDDVLRKNGHFAGGEALQGANTATTLRWKNGKVTVTDGPYTETKEQLGGILILEARDLNHAIQSHMPTRRPARHGPHVHCKMFRIGPVHGRSISGRSNDKDRRMKTAADMINGPGY